MIYTKPDGEIEILSNGCCCPPGAARPGQHTNASTHWYRLRMGMAFVLWTPWVRVHSQTKARILAGAAETCAEFELAMLEAQEILP